MPNALVIDHTALGILDTALIEEDWFSDFEIPANAQGLKRLQVGNSIYLLSETAHEGAGLLVINLGMFSRLDKGLSKSGLFERIGRVALRHFDRNVTLPVTWQPFHDGSLLSVYAQPIRRKTGVRIYFDQKPAGEQNIYAYAIDDPRPLREVPPDLNIYRAAISTYEDALFAEGAVSAPVGNYGILLRNPFAERLVSAGTLSEWYPRRLNEDQLRFVKEPSDKPIRLRGAAGTGKTQAMVIKCLKELYEADAQDKTNATAFLTHSSALAHEVIRGMLYALDPSQKWAELRTPDGKPRLWLGTLYELAAELSDYQKKGLRPLALDGIEGRELQRLLIGEAIQSACSDARVALTLLKQSSVLAPRLVSSENRDLLVDEIMNEFACVLDAENARRGTESAAKYLRARRESWQMPLPTEQDRALILEIYEYYRQSLQREGLLSLDQMIADFGRYLTSHEWQQLKGRDGFDTIFVDEYHYFGRLEAMTLHGLFKPRAERNSRWPLIMAYDLKQSPNDIALGGGIEKFKNPGVGESLPLDLTEVFRSTPQITAFLTDIDGSYPAMDMEGEFKTYSGRSRVEEGPKPCVVEFATDRELAETVFDRAVARGRGLPNGGSQVAVLCLNEQLFEVYRTASRLAPKHVTVTSRDDLRQLRYAKSRCVFSMPDYVAGLQFDSVYLIHADAVDYDEVQGSQGATRRYISRIYLGASRASRNLVVACSQARGGIAEPLRKSIERGSLVGIPRTDF